MKTLDEYKQIPEQVRIQSEYSIEFWTNRLRPTILFHVGAGRGLLFCCLLSLQPTIESDLYSLALSEYANILHIQSLSFSRAKLAYAFTICNQNLDIFLIF